MESARVNNLGTPGGHSILAMCRFIFSNLRIISASCVRTDYKFLAARIPSFGEGSMFSGPIIEKQSSRHLMFANSTLIKLFKMKFLYPNRIWLFLISCAEVSFDVSACMCISLKSGWKITRCCFKVKPMFYKIIFAQPLEL